MVALERTDDAPIGDQIVVFHDFTWQDFEALLERRGERSVPRMAYLDGELELMSPSFPHESIGAVIARLVEVYCESRNISFVAAGSWTLKEGRREAGVEPDECYVLGDREIDPDDKTARPDLAIEVVWTRGLVNKLEIYRRLGVREVWVWRLGQLAVHVLRGERYEEVTASEVVPGIDLAQLVSFLDRKKTSDAMREYRAALHAK